MNSLEKIEADLVAAEDEVRKINEQIIELRAVKRAANAKVDVLARQRESLLRNDPTRRRMVIGG